MQTTHAPITTESALVQLLAELGLPGFVGDSDPNAWATDRYELAIYVPRGATLAAVESILAYVWSGPMRGEWWGGQDAALVDSHLFCFGVDSTKSQRDDLPDAWDAHKAWLTTGTPVRTTNQAGPGTRDTRACAGLGPVLLAWR